MCLDCTCFCLDFTCVCLHFKCVRLDFTCFCLNCTCFCLDCKCFCLDCTCLCLDCTCVVPRERLGVCNIRRFKRRIYPALLYSSVRISGNTWNVVFLFLCMCRLLFMVFLKDNIQITLFCRHLSFILCG